jgi:dCTP diphosphatase
MTTPPTPFSSHVTVEDLRRAMEMFVDERGWQKFHTPRNIVLALVGEVGELAEIFQWKGEVLPGLHDWQETDRTHLGEELADCLLYICRLSDRCGIDLPAAALRKMELNRRKYPVDKCYGSSDKYTAYAVSNPVAAASDSASTVALQPAHIATPQNSDSTAPDRLRLTVAAIAAVALFGVAVLSRSRV